MYLLSHMLLEVLLCKGQDNRKIKIIDPHASCAKAYRQSGSNIPIRLYHMNHLFPQNTWKVYATISNFARTNKTGESRNNGYCSLVGHLHPTHRFHLQEPHNCKPYSSPVCLIPTAVYLHKRHKVI